MDLNLFDILMNIIPGAFVVACIAHVVRVILITRNEERYYQESRLDYLAERAERDRWRKEVKEMLIKIRHGEGMIHDKLCEIERAIEKEGSNAD